MVTPFGDGRDWFLARRFGMFVHWGLYAIPGWHEQMQWRGVVPRDQYGLLKDQFNPVSFNPDAWLELMQASGMEYLCITTKHHDGFCLWDTAQTPFNVMQSPYGRDIIGAIADACHRRGVPLCLYYSIADWHHPNYPNLGRHHELPSALPGDRPDWDAYMAFLVAQVRELCTNYGTLHGFWWDMNVPELHDPSVNAMIRGLQPLAVINNRGFDQGDFSTPERHVPDSRRFTKLTEACQSVGRESWGYRADEDYYTPSHLEHSIARMVAMGGNYLLNVGPKGDGTIPEASASLLRRVGSWYGSVREGLTAEPAPHLVNDPSLNVTREGDNVYIVVPSSTESSSVGLRPIATLPNSAMLMNTGMPVETCVDLTPRGWYEQWNEGVREADGGTPLPYLRLRGLPIGRAEGEPLVIRLSFGRGVLDAV